MDTQYSYFFRLSSILEAMPDALIIINENGRIILINGQTEKLFGFERGELLGDLIEVLIPTRFRDKHHNHRENYFTNPRTRPMGAGLELFGLHKNGSEFPIELSLSPLKTDESVLVLAALRDISHRKKLEEQIRQQNSELRTKNTELEKINFHIQETSNLKNQFLANMSHELRTPLNGIIGFAELMFYEKVGEVSVEHKEFLSDILLSSRHLLQLINDVLDLAKIESGKIEFHHEQADLPKIISEVVDILRTLIAKKFLHLEVEIDPTVSSVIIDASKLKQVLYNYISNAIKFSPETGRITIRVLPEGSEFFCLEITDTGIGIHEDDIDKLFVEFQQLDSRMTKNYQGTGLGLALTKRIVEAQGGRVGVKSEVDKGSTFYAILPRENKLRSSVNMTLNSALLAPIDKHESKILIIGNDNAARKTLLICLVEAGYSADVATNGTEALQLCAKFRYSAIIIDLILPDVSGWEVIRIIRDDHLNFDAPIIVLSDSKEDETSLGYSIHDFLTKPININHLINALNRANVVTKINID